MGQRKHSARSHFRSQDIGSFKKQQGLGRSQGANFFQERQRLRKMFDDVGSRKEIKPLREIGFFKTAVNDLEAISLPGIIRLLAIRLHSDNRTPLPAQPPT